MFKLFWKKLSRDWMRLNTEGQNKDDTRAVGIENGIRTQMED